MANALVVFAYVVCAEDDKVFCLSHRTGIMALPFMLITQKNIRERTYYYERKRTD